MEREIARRALAAVGVLAAAAGCGGQVDDEPSRSIGASDDTASIGTAQQAFIESSVATLSSTIVTSFGQSVAVFGDLAVIGAPDDPNALQMTASGSVSIFTRSDSGWTLVQKISGTVANQRFGVAVAINPTGDRIAIVGDGTAASSKRFEVRKKNGSVWDSEYSETTAPHKDVSFDRGDSTGRRLAVTGDTGLSIRKWVSPGNWPVLVVNSKQVSVNTPGFHVAFNNNSLAQSRHIQACTNPTRPLDEVTGIEFDPTGVDPVGPLIYHNNIQETEAPCPPGNAFCHCGAEFGSALALTNDGLFVGEQSYDPVLWGGRAYRFFESSTGTFCFNGCPANGQIFAAPTLGSKFGSSLAVDSANLVIGEAKAPAAGTDAGAVYSYTKTASGWAYANTFLPVTPANSGKLGTAVALSRNAILAGAPGSKKVYEFFVDHRSPDFNRDNKADLLIGAPGAQYGSPLKPGGVANLFVDAMSATGAMSLTEAQTDLGEQDFSLFGATLAWGRFDSDTYDDLIVGAPWRQIGGTSLAGSVYYYKGRASPPGFIFTSSLNRATLGVEGDPGANDSFGFPAVGDFNGDGYDDIAIGAPGSTAVVGGSVQVIPGSSAGPTVVTDFIVPDPAPAAAGDSFGRFLASADFNCDGFDDLAVSAHMKADGGMATAGRVYIYFGSGSGLVVPPSPQFFADSSFLGAQADAQFGSALAVGNVNGDFNPSNGRQCADLVIGAPLEDVSGVHDAGRGYVLRGGVAGFTTNQFDQGSLGGTVEADDHFGFSFAILRINTGLYEDLVVGVPGENGTGAVQIVPGSLNGLILTSGSGPLLTEQSIGVTATAGDTWGFNVVAVDDRTIGVNANGKNASAGSVNVFRFISGTGFSPDLSVVRTYDQSSLPQPPNLSASNTLFGFGMVSRKPGR